MPKGDTVILHKQLTSVGGAQEVAYEMARSLDAPIYAGWVDQKLVPDDVKAIQLFSDWTQRINNLHYAATDAFMMLAWQHLPEIYKYDNVILNQTTCTWFVPREDQSVVWYAHHPPRGQYDMWHRNDKTLFNSTVATIQRTLYRPTMDYPDVIVANSETTASRFDRYFNIDVDTVIYPPVEKERFDPGECLTSGYYLSLSRLSPNKRVPEIVKAFEQEGVDLVIAGTGSQEEEVRAAADKHTEVLGYVSDEEKIRLMSGAKGFVMNAEQEDYGMAPVEAMASGTPVLGVNEGYTPHHITKGVNGVIYKRGELGPAIRRAEKIKWDETEIVESVQKGKMFSTEIKDAIELAQQ